MINRSHNPYFTLSLIIVCTLLVFQSCTKPTNNTYSIFKYNESAGVVSLDPAFARDQAHIWVCNQLYNSLVKLNDSLIIQPSIAKSWSISDDGLTYIFNLRSDVFFHTDSCFTSGNRKVVASDFVFSFNRLLNPKTASPGSWVLSKVDKQNNIYSILALNDTTLQIKLSEPFPPFLGILSMKYCSVIPKEAITFYGSSFRKHPVGTGPFYIKNWVENIKLVLGKNPEYFEFHNGNRLPYIDGVAISFLIDKMTAFMEFAKGNFDFISGIDPTYKDEIITRDGNLKSKYRNRFSMIVGPYLNTEYLAFFVDISLNKSNNPLNNKHIRQAINYGFDRSKMIHYLRNGIGTPGTGGIIPVGMPSTTGTLNYGYDYNPELARQLIKLAGYDANNKVPQITLTTTPDYVDLCKFVQSQLSDIGIDLSISVSPSATVRELKANGKLSFFRASWIADYPDEENYLSMFYSGNFAPNGPNYTHFSNSKIDSLYLKSFVINDRNIKNKIYNTIDSLIMDEAPVAVLYYDQVTLFTQKNITGLTVNPVNNLNLELVKKNN